MEKITLGEIMGVIVFISGFWISVRPLSKKLSYIFNFMKTTERHTKANYMSNLRLTVMSPYMPILERLIAGSEYISLDGNGEIEVEYELLKKEYIEQKNMTKNEYKEFIEKKEEKRGSF